MPLCTGHRVQELFQSNLPVKGNMPLAFPKEHLQSESYFHNYLHHNYLSDKGEKYCRMDHQPWNNPFLTLILL